MDRFSIEWSESDRCAFVVLEGFWDEGEVRGFETALANVIAAAGGRTFDAVADLSAVGAQSQAVIALQSGVVSRLVAAGMVRLAIVGAGALLTMQVKRLSAPLVPFFTETRGAALRWLRDEA